MTTTTGTPKEPEIVVIPGMSRLPYLASNSETIALSGANLANLENSVFSSKYRNLAASRSSQNGNKRAIIRAINLCQMASSGHMGDGSASGSAAEVSLEKTHEN